MLPAGRVSGVLLPLFSFRSRTDWGIGDFGALPAFFRWMEAAHQRLLMVLPLLPTAPGDTSPYSTRSAFGLNPLFIDLAQLPEASDLPPLEAVRAAPRIAYPEVFRLKGAALRRAFERFESTEAATRGARAKAFERYSSEQREWLEPFALFSALSDEAGLKPWWEWPEPLRNRQPDALADAATRLGTEVRYHGWLQWVAESQWNEVRRAAREHQILLCGDEPFIIGKDSADCWAHPEELRCDMRLGAPPDAFSAVGQDWGLPYFDFPRMEQNGFAWLRARAKKAASYYDLRRVDHAVGYFRQWIKEESAPAGHGHFIPPDESLHRALGERHFRLLSEGAGIVAEDLGVVPPWVRQTLTDLGLPGFRVLRWERDDGVYRNPHLFPPLSLVCTGTHDTATLREWWETAANHEREAMARAYPEFSGASLDGAFTADVHRRFLAAAQNAGSALCVLPWPDVLGTPDRINVPGSMTDANWSYRMATPVEELLTDPATKAAAEQLARLTDAASR